MIAKPGSYLRAQVQILAPQPPTLIRPLQRTAIFFVSGPAPLAAAHAARIAASPHGASLLALLVGSWAQLDAIDPRADTPSLRRGQLPPALVRAPRPCVDRTGRLGCRRTSRAELGASAGSAASAAFSALSSARRPLIAARRARPRSPHHAGDLAVDLGDASLARRLSFPCGLAMSRDLHLHGVVCRARSTTVCCSPIH